MTTEFISLSLSSTAVFINTLSPIIVAKIDSYTQQHSDWRQHAMIIVVDIVIANSKHPFWILFLIDGLRLS